MKRVQYLLRSALLPCFCQQTLRLQRERERNRTDPRVCNNSHVSRCQGRAKSDESPRVGFVVIQTHNRNRKRNRERKLRNVRATLLARQCHATTLSSQSIGSPPLPPLLLSLRPLSGQAKCNIASQKRQAEPTVTASTLSEPVAIIN